MNHALLINKRHSLKIGLAAILILLTGTLTVSAQEGISTVDIAGIETSTFPDVIVQVRLLNSEGIAVSSIPSDALSVTENGDPVNFEFEAVDAGIQVALVMDIGAGIRGPGATGKNRGEEIQEIAIRFIDGMGENDAAMVVVVSDAGVNVLLSLTSDKEQLRATVSSMTIASHLTLTNGLEGVAVAFDSLSASPGIPQHQAVMLLSSGIQSTTTLGFNDVVTVANSLDIPIHTIQVRESTQGADSLTRLSRDTDGIHTYYDTETATDPLLELIQQQRNQFEITFRSGLNVSSERTVELAVVSSDPNAARDFVNYTVSLQAPSFVISAPQAAEEFIRDARSGNVELDAVEPTQTTVAATTVWPDGFPRTIIRAQLFIDGVETGSSITNPGNTINLPWDLRPYRTTGENQVQVQIEVIDELGFRTLSEPVLVKVTVLPPAVIIDCSNFTGVGLITCTINKIAGPASLIIALAALAVAVLIFLNRGTVVAVAGQAGVAVGEFVARVTNPIGNRQAAAYLTVLRGDPLLVDTTFPIYADTITPIGRDRRLAEVVFHEQIENSVVSGKHCEIIHEYNGNISEFKLRDFGSTNGTFLNNTRLDELQEEGLHDSDEIAIGPVERGGVLLRFEIVGDDFVDDTDTRTTRPSF